MKYGSYDVHSLDTGLFRLDGGAMFGVVPRNLWERTNPPDEKNRILMALRTLLVRGNGRTILIDTGVGEKYGEKFRSIYSIDLENRTLEQRLGEYGVRPEDVTDVILTHLHFDHVGGAVRREGNALAPAFPNARHYLQKRHWEWAMRPSDRDKASFIPENYMPLYERGMVDVVDGTTELFPGIRLETVDGHTFAQQLVRIVDDRRSIVFCCDLIPMSAHVPAPYIMGYDLQPLVTLEEKTRFLAKAVDDRDILVFEHDPFVQGGIVLSDEKGFRLTESGTLNDMIVAQERLLRG
jgi:glyoxylase-like metal-dependent hydrolase (beta-lactamase superfamily II)